MKLKFNIFNELRYFYDVVITDFSFFGSYAFFGCAVIFLLLINQTDFAWKVLVGTLFFPVVEVAIKLFYKKNRPDFRKVKTKTLFQTFEESTAFPSGHSGKIAMFTVLLQLQYSFVPLTIFFAVLALLVGISRKFLSRHYFVDVLGGYVLGILIALFLYSF